MLKRIKELLRLSKSIEEKEKVLEKLESNIGSKQVIWNEIIDEAQNQANYNANEIITHANQQVERMIADGESRLAEVDKEIANKDLYLQEVKAIQAEHIKLEKQIDSQKNKLARIKTLYQAIEYAADKFKSGDLNIQDTSITHEEFEEVETYTPTVTLKLHAMDIKELKKAFNENDKLISKVLDKYKERYTTKANAAIYKLMVIALRAELQNVLYDLKYNKLEKSIENIKVITQKYLVIASEGNQSIAPTMVKFIGEIEYLFIQAIKIEYEYYVKKEKQKEEQAMLREQMRQEAEERKILEQQKKQVEKEEEKYRNEILKVQEMAKLAVEEEKLLQLNAKIAELESQLNAVEDRKVDIVSRQNGKAGYVYIISNLGAFGEEVFKIGMTRRLDPQDRVNELGDASVPFPYDVHSFIFSDDAVGLEQKLHGIFNEQRLNKVNLRKEFFKVSIENLEKYVTEIDPSAEFTTTMLAEQYRQTLSIEEENI